jgi:hypothetical protein
MTDERDRPTTTGAHAAPPEAPEHDVLEELQAELAAELEEERPPAGGPAYQTVGAAVALAIGVGGALLALDYGLGSLARPGPGLWPFAVSVLIVGLSLLLLVIGRRLDDSEAFSRNSLLVLVGTLTFVGLAVLMPRIGFEIPTLLLSVVWLRWLGGESWRSTVTVAVLTTAAFYALFILALRIPLPHLF